MGAKYRQCNIRVEIGPHVHKSNRMLHLGLRLNAIKARLARIHGDPNPIAIEHEGRILTTCSFLGGH